MGIRSLLQLSFVGAALTLAPLALADIPNPTGGSAGSSSKSSTSSGAGGASSQSDANCTVSQESIAGSTCQECNTGTGTGVTADPSCGTLSSDYNFVCQSSTAVAIYCNGPIRDQPSDQNTDGCSVSRPGATADGLACVALVAAAAFMMRRRRR